MAWLEKLRQDYIEKFREKEKEFHEFVYVMSGLLSCLTSSVIVIGEDKKQRKKDVPSDLRDFVTHGDIAGLKYRIVTRWKYSFDWFTIFKDDLRHPKVKECIEKILKDLGEEPKNYMKETEEGHLRINIDVLSHFHRYIAGQFDIETFYRNTYHDYVSRFPEAFARGE